MIVLVTAGLGNIIKITFFFYFGNSNSVEKHKIFFEFTFNIRVG